MPWVLASIFLLVSWAKLASCRPVQARTVRRGSATNRYRQAGEDRKVIAVLASGLKRSEGPVYGVDHCVESLPGIAEVKVSPRLAASFHPSWWITPHLPVNEGRVWAFSHHTTAAPTMPLSSPEQYKQG